MSPETQKTHWLLKKLESKPARLIAAIVFAAMAVLAVLVSGIIESASQGSFIVEPSYFALVLVQFAYIAPKYIALWIASLFTSDRKAAAKGYLIALAALAIYDTIFMSFMLHENLNPDYSLPEGYTSYGYSAPKPSLADQLEATGSAVMAIPAILVFMTSYFVLKNKKQA